MKLLLLLALLIPVQSAATATDDALAEFSSWDGFIVWGQSNAGETSSYKLDDVASTIFEAGSPYKAYVYRSGEWVLGNDWPCADSQCTGTECTGANRTAAGHPDVVDGGDGDGTCTCTCGFTVDTSLGTELRGWKAEFVRLWTQKRQRSVLLNSTSVGGSCLVATAAQGCGTGEPYWEPEAFLAGPAVVGDIWTDRLPENNQDEVGEMLARGVYDVFGSGAAAFSKACLWMQGEGDATAGISLSAYKAALKEIADVCWEVFQVPTFAAPLSLKSNDDDSCSSSAGEVEIRQAILEAVSEHAQLHMGPDMDDVLYGGNGGADCAHIWDWERVGCLWFNAVDAVLDGRVGPVSCPTASPPS